MRIENSLLHCPDPSRLPSPLTSLSIHLLPDALAGLIWRPFVTPAPLWDLWWLLIIPLVAGVAMVYKTTKCRRPSDIPLEAAKLTGVILISMLLGAAALTILVKIVLG